MTVNEHTLLPLQADWSTPVRLSHGWEGGLSAALRGNEQRASLRSTPRRTLEFTADRDSIAAIADLRARLLEGWKFTHGTPGANVNTGRFAVPWHGRASWIAEVGEATFGIDASPWTWAVPDYFIIFDAEGLWAVGQVTVVDGSAIAFDALGDWELTLAAGLPVLPLFFGTMDRAKVAALTRDCADATVRVEGDVRVTAEQDEQPPAPETFALFLCLDETGSIGTGGAAAGIAVIDEFRSAFGDTQIAGIGFVSFGDVLCETFAFTTDIDAVRDRLEEVVNSAGTDPVFFQDGGGDTPENGVDALEAALDALLASADAQAANKRYIYLRTDTLGFAHNAADPAAILARLLAEPDKTWLEFGEAVEGDETHYADAFPAGAKIIHGAFAP